MEGRAEGAPNVPSASACGFGCVPRPMAASHPLRGYEPAPESHAGADAPPRCASRHAAEQKVLHECLLHVHAILAAARSLWLLHIRCADMSLRRNSLLALARHRVALHATRPSKRYSMSAFCTCMRFSASSQTTDWGPSMTSASTSSPRCEE